jgi:hypothetical protein
MANLTSYKDIIDQCHLRVLDSLKTLDNELSNNIGRALEREIDNTASHKQHAIALDSAFIYKKSKHIINESFSEQLNSGFKKFKTNELDTQVRENEFHKEAWSLVDDDVLEETISIRSLSSEANQLHKDKIWQLEQRLTFLNKGLPINESSNPMSPLQFFSALRFGLKKAPIDISGKIVCYKSLSECLIKRYANLLNIVNTILIQEDILPGLNYANQHSSIAGNEPPTQKKNELHTVEEKDKVYPLPDGSAETSNDIVQNNNGVENGNRSEPVESISNNDVQDTNTSGSSQIPLVNAIRNLLQRARKLSDEDVAVPVPINHQQHTTEQIGEKVEQALTDATTESLTNTPLSDATTTLGIARGETVTPEPATQQPIDDRTLTQEPIIFDASRIVEAVESVQASAATAHFFSNDTQAQVLTAPTNIAENSARVYEKLVQEAPNGSIDAKNMYTIDMVGMLFEYILADENLPDSIKTLLSHLHTPFLKLAFIDESFFENTEHKSRMLLDSLADAGASFVGHDGVSQYNMYEEIKRIVQRIIKEFKNDVNLFAELLMEFTLLKKRITHMHNLKERNSIEKKQGQEKHAQAKITARQEIKKRIDGRRVPSSIINLLSPWFVYLTFIQLKEDKGSKKWTDALAVIDNLITYCSIKQIKDDAAALEKGFKKIIQQVELGLADIAYNPAKIAAIVKELEQLKTKVISRQAIKTTITKAKESADKDSAESKQAAAETPTPEEERVMNYIKLIEPGTWIEYEKTARMKVNRFNSESRQYILVNQSNQDVIMLTRLELARDILSEKATVLDGNAKPLFERALERIKHNLDKQIQLDG